MESIPKVQNKEIIHFKKMNIFGCSGVGKSSLISLIENYNDNDDNFHIKNSLEKENPSIDFSEYLVEQVKRVIFPINDKRNMNLLIYETNINHFETIKTNLDTLLFQTECILIMWDNSNSISFDRIPDLITLIISLIKEELIDKVDIFLIQNKIDVKFDDNEDGLSEEEIKEKIAELKKEYKYIYEMKTSFINKQDMFKLLLDIDRNYNKENFDEYNTMSLVKIKYPFRSIDKLDGIKPVNICLVGDSDSGKSTFLKNLVGHEEYSRYLEEKYEPNYSVTINDENAIIKLSEVPGKEIEKAKIDIYFKSCYGFLLFFDVTKKDDSFTSLKRWIKLIKEKSNSSIIIIANKIDLKDKREINKGEADSFAKEQNCKYYECSSLSGINVLEIFNEIALDAYEYFISLNLSKKGTFSLKKGEILIDEKGNIQLRKKNEKHRCC